MARIVSNVIFAVIVLACLLPFCLATTDKAESWAAKYKKIGQIVIDENRAIISGVEDGEHNRELLYIDDVRFCAIPADQEVQIGM